MIDTDRLLAHLRARADHPDAVLYAVFTGLAARIERGDFDIDQKDQT
ncbi:hypothetical protein [Clavibacter sp. VKM Ac-2872]|nr:hypothetical protein [Clavibacter sp. VKM Ac-2872]MBF4625524.1 hypothetical protein [Clavibacter sp. VKM Ac-2872]